MQSTPPSLQTPQEAKIGKLSPSFHVEAVADGDKFIEVELKDYLGKWLVLFFYPLDFTFICPTEITAFSKRYDEFRALGVEVLGGSTDSKHSHKAWLKELGALRFPLFSDLNKSMARDYGVLVPEEGTALRGTFIIDPEGILKYALIHDNGVGRSVTETLRVLQAFQTGDLCPVDWQQGEQTLGK
ncbi:peroxiredoxin [Candidatus Uhrbacteria bacterium]|nr:peroxiredoxin [Candidatus Uhrbacteria bacterium]